MDRRIKGLIRPTIALLLVGIIVGLIFLYMQYDSRDGVSADKENNDSIEENMTPDIDDNMEQNKPNIEGDTKPIEPKPDGDVEAGIIDTEYILPRSIKNGEIVIGGDGVSNAQHVVSFLGGDIIVGTTNATKGDFDAGGKTGVFVAYIENKIFKKRLLISEDNDLELLGVRVGRYGLAVVTLCGKDILIYTINYDFELNKLKSVNDVDINSVHIGNSDNLSMCYRQSNKSVLDMYDEKLIDNTILTIDIDSPVRAVYSPGDGNTYVVCGSGDIVLIDNVGVRTIKNIGVTIEDIEPVVIENRVKYAMIGKVNGETKMMIASQKFDIELVTRTHGDKVLFIDKLYAVNTLTHDLDIYCTCGEYVSSSKVDIRDINYIDYATKTLYYIDSFGVSKSATFDNGIIGTTTYDNAVIHASNDFTIYNNDRVRIVFDV